MNFGVGGWGDRALNVCSGAMAAESAGIGAAAAANQRRRSVWVKRRRGFSFRPFSTRTADLELPIVALHSADARQKAQHGGLKKAGYREEG